MLNPDENIDTRPTKAATMLDLEPTKERLRISGIRNQVQTDNEVIIAALITEVELPRKKNADLRYELESIRGIG